MQILDQWPLPSGDQPVTGFVGFSTEGPTSWETPDTGRLGQWLPWASVTLAMFQGTVTIQLLGLELPWPVSVTPPYQWGVDCGVSQTLIIVFANSSSLLTSFLVGRVLISSFCSPTEWPRKGDCNPSSPKWGRILINLIEACNSSLLARDWVSRGTWYALVWYY